MKRLRLRAFVLAAGHGLRLRPLSLFTPKPLLPVCGQPVIGHTLRRLKKIGCEAAVVNLHHLAETLPEHLGRSWFGLPLIYSPEEEIQGTLGALYPQREILAAADLVLVVNGDTLCRWPWRAMIRRHLRSGADATLLLHRRSPDAALGGGIGVDGQGFVAQLRDHDPVAEVTRRHIFAGAQVLQPRLLDRLEKGPADSIDDLYLPLLRDGGRIAGFTTGKPWHDLGTPERYLAASLDWLRGPGRRKRISPLAEVSDRATVQHSAVEAGAVVESDVKIERSILLSGARVASGSTIRSSIIGPGVRLEAANIERRMINRTKVDYQPSADESMMGDLVYTPI